MRGVLRHLFGEVTRWSSSTKVKTVLNSRSTFSLARGSRFVPRICSIRFSISAGLVFGISSPLPILDRSPSHSRGNNYFDRPLPQSAFDWEDFSADVRLFLKGTPPHRRDTNIERRRRVLGFEVDIAAHPVKRERDMKAIKPRKYFMREKSRAMNPAFSLCNEAPHQTLNYSPIRDGVIF